MTVKNVVRTTCKNSGIKTVDFKKTVECNPAEKGEKRLECIPAKKFQSKNSGMHSSRKTLELYQTGPNSQKKI